MGKVSGYAKSSLQKGDFDEVYTEFKVHEDLR